ncbi:MAG: RNA polymerase factor sigma-32 [Myxococcales bacterium]|nr:RNA polymerase factor sigma-32 [Myxococcales bacterium]
MAKTEGKAPRARSTGAKSAPAGRKSAAARKQAASQPREDGDTADETPDEAADEGSEFDPEVDEPATVALVAAPSAALVLAAEVDEDADDDPDQEMSIIDVHEPVASRPTDLYQRDPLQIYMEQARRFPLLSAQQEHELAVQYFEHGDAAAARRLVEANLRLVVKIAYEYRRAHKTIVDLVQEGNIGLLQAVRKYDPYRGVKLSSYAAFWIRAYILKFVLNNWRLVKIGTTQAQRKLFFNLRKERERLERLGFAPTAKLIAENLDVSERDVVEMEKRMAAPEASLDAPVGSDDEDGRTRLDMLASGDLDPADAAEAKEFSALLAEKLEIFAKGLDGRDQVLFRERWLVEEPRTLQDIGDTYGISRERARQLEQRILGNLRVYLRQELGGAVDIDALSRD